MSRYTPNQIEKLRNCDASLNVAVNYLAKTAMTLQELNNSCFSSTVRSIKETIGDLEVSKAIISNEITGT